MKWREFATAPKYASVWEQASDIGATLLGTLGLAEAVTDNASVNVIPLAVRELGAAVRRARGRRHVCCV